MLGISGGGTCSHSSMGGVALSRDARAQHRLVRRQWVQRPRFVASIDCRFTLIWCIAAAVSLAVAVLRRLGWPGQAVEGRGGAVVGRCTVLPTSSRIIPCFTMPRGVCRTPLRLHARLHRRYTYVRTPTPICAYTYTQRACGVRQTSTIRRVRRRRSTSRAVVQGAPLATPC